MQHNVITNEQKKILRTSDANEVIIKKQPFNNEKLQKPP